MSKKYLWSAKIIYTIEYETGWFKKTTKRDTETREIDEVFYGNWGITEEVKKYSKYYKSEVVPYLFEMGKYKIIEKKVETFIVSNVSFDYLKEHMLANEFIEYVHDTWNSLEKLVE